MSEQFLLVGHPVSHSVSPQIHGAAYEALGRSGRYDLFDAVDEAAVKSVVERIRRGEVRGANVTVPWKKLALELADERAASAEAIGAANVLSLDTQGRVVASNTDAVALAAELREASSFLTAERDTAVVLGIGGAALASVVSARDAGFTRVLVSGRRYVAGTPESDWPDAADFRRLGAEPIPWPVAGQKFAVDRRWGAVIQATSAGMKGKEGGEELAALVPWDALAPLLAYDLVYNPPVTPFLREAARSGHHARGGLGMLVGQAARAIEIWWGVLPPSAPLFAAARAALGLPQEDSSGQ